MSIDFDEYPITEEEVISILGNNYKVQGNELIWACAGCRAVGRDTTGDNLRYNREKRVLKCFSCDYAKEITSIIARRRFEQERGGNVLYNNYTPRYTPKLKEDEEEKIKPQEIKQEYLDEYYLECMSNLMRNKDVLRKMYEKHTILPKTALDCYIGYDSNKDMLVFPSRAVVEKDPTKTTLTDTIANGAEYREYEGEKKVRRISGYDAKICCVYGGDFTMEAIICEGYKDAYNLLQILRITQSERLSYTAIFTVQNGTGSINANNCLQKTNFKRFDNVYLLMDKDEAGDKAVEVAKKHYPQMIDYREEFLGEYGDIQEKFKAEFSDKIDIERALSVQWLEDF